MVSKEEMSEATMREIERRGRKDPVFFARSLIIPSAEGRRLFDDCIEDFQLETFRKLKDSLRAIQVGTEPPIRRFWIERTKKASKDHDIATCVLWLMCFPFKPIKVQICASNHKQAKIVQNRAVEILYYNPWLEKYVEIIEGAIRNKKMRRQVWTHIEATDSQGAEHGETPDLLVLNELVHVAKWRAMEDHMQNADGTARSVVIIATNAGIRGTPAWRWRQNAFKHTDRWCVQKWSSPAPWAKEEDIEEARRRDPIGTEFERLWRGRWVSGVGDALSEDDVEGCFRRKEPLFEPEEGWVYLGGVDLGVSKDHAGVVIVGVHRTRQLVKVMCIRGFAPEVPNGDKLEVNSNDVEVHVKQQWESFRFLTCFYDPAAGGSFMAQRLRKEGVPMTEAKFSMPGFQTAMATSLVQLVKARMLECYEDQEGRLRRDIAKFFIEHKPPNSYKLKAVSDIHGHADVGIAMTMTLPRAVELLGWRLGLSPTDDLICENNEPLTEEEEEDLPDEFKEMNKMYEEVGLEKRLEAFYK